jgi:hypothetical protein
VNATEYIWKGGTAAEELVDEWVEDVFNREQEHRDAWASGAVERAWKAGYAAATETWETGKHWDRYHDHAAEEIAERAWKRAKYEE